jgi:hypothetical protein
LRLAFLVCFPLPRIRDSTGRTGLYPLSTGLHCLETRSVISNLRPSFQDQKRTPSIRKIARGSGSRPASTGSCSAYSTSGLFNPVQLILIKTHRLFSNYVLISTSVYSTAAEPNTQILLSQLLPTVSFFPQPTFQKSSSEESRTKQALCRCVEFQVGF